MFDFGTGEMLQISANLPSTGVSFVVVTYNSRGTVQGCLESILHQTLPPAELVVVDNASQDDTANLVESEFPSLKVIRNRKNLGYGAANNIGVASTEGNVIGIVNPDVHLHPRWSEEILSVLGRTPGCAAVEGKMLLQGDERVVNSRGSGLNLLGFGCMAHYGERDAHDEEAQERAVSYPSGAAFGIRKDAFLSVGGFDEAYFLYHEDVDLGVRLYASNWTVYYSASALAYHDFKESMSPDKVYFLEKNRWRTLLKNMPWSYFVRCGPLLMVSELGIAWYLFLHGLLRQKARATMQVAREIPEIMELRRRDSIRGATRSQPVSMLSDSFPRFPVTSERVEALGTSLQRKYLRAFFTSPDPRFTF